LEIDAAAVFHLIFIQKPFSMTDQIGLYVGTFCQRRACAYVLTQVQPNAGATELTFAPTGRGLTHQPGQFVFVSFDAPGLGEPHPFTISSAANDEKSLRISAIALGDHTHRLQSALNVGATAQIQGPFGRFLRKPTAAPEIWSAGGIGITPFAAWAQALPASGPDIHLFHCVPSADLANHHPETKAAFAAVPNAHYHLISRA
jgi:predicted ferric reductase